ncbi:hypothetical protein ANN_15071 [Periplaneta americana]|uniref:Uncharacterized protein n=1 Tax=Periplaneta americana TaxID=6978 RepID=A0ABQ8SZ78_PERAM|nr:hypothetical protein ANN_15071 [Periplaneta americana]
MAGLCEGGNETPGSLKANKIYVKHSLTWSGRVPEAWKDMKDDEKDVLCRGIKKVTCSGCSGAHGYG